MRVVKGFTYLMLLWWVAVGSVMLAAIGQSWSIDVRRMREQELVFRGGQIRVALQRYRDASPGEVKTYPHKLAELLEDGRNGRPQRHLRRLWPDPITGSPEWGLVKDGEQIVGVFSTSTKVPLAPPDNVKSYQDWVFAAQAASSPSTSASAPPASTSVSEM